MRERGLTERASDGPTLFSIYSVRSAQEEEEEEEEEEDILDRGDLRVIGCTKGVASHLLTIAVPFPLPHPHQQMLTRLL